MTLTIYDSTQAISVTATPEQAIGLLGDLPAGVRVRIRADGEHQRQRSITRRVRDQYPEAEYIGGVGWCGPEWQQATDLERRLRAEVPQVLVHTGTEGTVQEPQPPGYFGLAVAQAYDVWGQPRTAPQAWATTEADRVEALHGEYQEYLRGERPDPRD